MHDLTGEEAMNLEAIKYVLQEVREEANVELLLDAACTRQTGEDQSEEQNSGNDLHDLPGSEPPEPIWLKWRK